MEGCSDDCAAWKEERAGRTPDPAEGRRAEGRCAADCRRLQLFRRHGFPHARDNIQVSGLGNTNPSPPHFLFLFLSSSPNDKKGKFHQREMKSFRPATAHAEDVPDCRSFLFGLFDTGSQKSRLWLLLSSSCIVSPCLGLPSCTFTDLYLSGDAKSAPPPSLLLLLLFFFSLVCPW